MLYGLRDGRSFQKTGNDGLIMAGKKGDRLRRSTRMICFIPLRSTMTAPSTPGTVSPLEWRGPELTAIRGVPVSFAHLTMPCTSLILPGLTIPPGRIGGTKLKSLEYS